MEVITLLLSRTNISKNGKIWESFQLCGSGVAVKLIDGRNELYAVHVKHSNVKIKIVQFLF